MLASVRSGSASGEVRPAPVFIAKRVKQRGFWISESLGFWDCDYGIMDLLTIPNIVWRRPQNNPSSASGREARQPCDPQQGRDEASARHCPSSALTPPRSLAVWGLGPEQLEWGLPTSFRQKPWGSWNHLTWSNPSLNISLVMGSHPALPLESCVIWARYLYFLCLGFPI